MQVSDVTLEDPGHYPFTQAYTIAKLVNRGKLVLVEPPRG
jgi:hypothetical protein